MNLKNNVLRRLIQKLYLKNSQQGKLLPIFDV